MNENSFLIAVNNGMIFIGFYFFIIVCGVASGWTILNELYKNNCNLGDGVHLRVNGSRSSFTGAGDDAP